MWKGESKSRQNHSQKDINEHNQNFKRPLTTEQRNKLKIHCWGGYISPYFNQRTINVLQTDNEKIKEVYSGENHIFIKKETKIYGIGENNFHQISHKEAKFYYQPQILDFQTSISVSKIICGCDFTYFITNDQQTYSQGLNVCGQLGLGHNNNVSSPQFVSALSQSVKISRSGTDRLLGHDEFIQDLVCGSLHVIALSNKGRLFSTGYGETYALGHDSSVSLNQFKEIQFMTEVIKHFDGEVSIEKIDCGVAHSGILISKNLFLWGMISKNKSHVLSKPQKILMNQGVQDFVLGDMLTVIQTESKEVYTLGTNIDGQLGIRDSKKRSLNTPTRINIPTEVDYILCGLNHVFALNNKRNAIYAWGSNKLGQINPYSQQDKILDPQKQDWLSNQSVQYVMKCSGNYTFFFSKTDIKKEEGKVGHNSNQEKQVHLLKQDLETVQKECVNLRNENRTLKQELIQMKQILQENNFISEKEVKKEDFDTNDEINYIIQQFKKTLKKDKTLKPHFEIDFKEIQKIKHIAEGGFGVIYKAKWRETIVAVKVLKSELLKEETIKDFLYECSAMESLRHPNIVTFMGACTKFPNLAIVLEYCPNKSLWSLLQNKNFNLKWIDRVKLALEISRGMNYLHCFQPPIIHRDLKSLNILIDEAFRAKIADFGWTRIKGDEMTDRIGTFQWMAPEVITGKNYSEKADVYSFGIILWEIAAREPPYKNIMGTKVSVEVVKNDLRPKIPKKAPEAMARLMKKCWDRNPVKRPSFKEIIMELEKMKMTNMDQ